jgi:hypothetical protein
MCTIFARATRPRLASCFSGFQRPRIPYPRLPEHKDVNYLILSIPQKTKSTITLLSSIPPLDNVYLEQWADNVLPGERIPNKK